MVPVVVAPEPALYLVSVALNPSKDLNGPGGQVFCINVKTSHSPQRLFRDSSKVDFFVVLKNCLFSHTAAVVWVGAGRNEATTLQSFT
jgi:hypothetical protein